MFHGRYELLNYLNDMNRKLAAVWVYWTEQ